MPRQHIYMSQKTLNGIRKLVDERRAEGASTSEANISSVSAELLSIGLRVTEQLKSKDGDVKKLDDEDKFKKLLLTEVIKSRQAAQAVLKFMFSLEEISRDGRFDFRELKMAFENELKAIKENYFSNE
ncbi:UNVERIFIED_ORG: TraM-like DNA-binding protein [Citrobacter freundii]